MDTNEAQQQQQMQAALKDAIDVICDACESEYFVPVLNNNFHNYILDRLNISYN